MGWLYRKIDFRPASPEECFCKPPDARNDINIEEGDIWFCEMCYKFYRTRLYPDRLTIAGTKLDWELLPEGIYEFRREALGGKDFFMKLEWMEK